MFYTDAYPNAAKVARAYMDGTNHISLVTDSIRSPSGITVDILKKRVYWVDNQLDYIETVDYSGRDRYVTIAS